jgi:hypothetical protein
MLFFDSGTLTYINHYIKTFKGPSRVYIALDTLKKAYCKVGFTSRDVSVRMHEGKLFNPYLSPVLELPGDRYLESTLKHLFRIDCIDGRETFRYSNQIKNFVQHYS